MSRVLIGSISSLMPACSSLSAANFRFSTKTSSSSAAVSARRRDAGQAIDLAAAQRLRIGDRRVDAFAELRRSGRAARRCRARPRPVAGRQVEQHLLQPVLLQPRGHHLRRMVVGADIFDRLEAGAGGGVEAVEKIMLAKEHRKIG